MKTFETVVSKVATEPDETGLLFIDTEKFREASEGVIDLIQPVGEPGGLSKIRDIEQSLDYLLQHPPFETVPEGFRWTDQGLVKEVDYIPSPVLDIKTEPVVPVTISTGKEESVFGKAEKQEAISSKLLGVGELAAELVSVKDPEGKLLEISKPVDQYFASLESLAASLVSDVQALKAQGITGQEAISYVSPETLRGIQEKTALLSQSLGIIPESGKLEFISKEALEGIQAFSEELKMAESLAATANQYVHIMSIDKSDMVPPEDLEGRRKAAEDALNRLWRDNPGGNAAKEIAYHFPGLAAGIISGEIDGLKIYESIRFYNALNSGHASELQMTRFASSSGINPYTRRDSFKAVDTDEKKARLLLCWKEIINDTADPYVALTLTSQLAQSVPDESTRNELTTWLESGSFDEELKSDSSWWIQMQGRDFALTPEGQATGALLFTGAISILSAGLGMATVAVGTLATGIFAASEVPNLVNFLEYGRKTDNVDTGRDPSTVAFNYNDSYKSSKSLTDDLLFNADKMDPAQRKLSLEEAQKSYDNLGRQLFADWWALQSTGKYDSALKEYNELGVILRRVAGNIDSATGEAIGSLAPAEETKNVFVPEGMIVSYNDDILPQGKTTSITEKEGTIGVLKMSQPGYHSDSMQLKFYGEGETEVSLSLKEIWGEEAESIREGSTAGWSDDETDFFGLKGIKEPESDRVGYSLYLYPGQTGKTLNKVYEGNPDMPTQWLLFGKPGEQLSIEISAPDMETSTINSFLPESSGAIFSKVLTESFASSLAKSQEMQKKASAEKQEAESKAWYIPTIQKDQSLYVDGKLVDVPVDGSSILITPGTHSYVIKQPGKQDVIGSFTVFGGDTFALAGQGKDPYTSSSSGGGGGGGGSAGTTKVSQNVYYPSTTTKEQTGWIKFTASAASGKIWLDDVEIVPVVDQLYQIDQGYHSVRMELTGKLPWSKSVYVGGGDTITVSPLWEDLPESDGEDQGEEPVIILPEKKRVYISSNPSGAKITVDGLATGEWTPAYLDLLPGYYTVGFIKSGYLQTELSLWVGESIAWGDLADSLAIAAGLI